MATSVDSPNVARVLDVGQVGERLYIVMEYIAGQPLSRIIHDLRRIGEHISLTSIADVVCGVLDGLHALHTAVAPDGTPLAFVHRDVAPKNLMLSDKGVPKVIDLGLGRSAQRDWETAQGIVMGSPGYIAPEQAMALETDHRADIFAMGIVLFELLTLKKYLVGDNLVELVLASTKDHYVAPSTIRADVSPELDVIVRRAVRLDPERRFQSAHEFGQALREVLPRTDGDCAQTLLTQIAWQELLETRAHVNNLAAMKSAFNPGEASRRVVFAQRAEPTAIVRAPSMRTTPQPASAPRKRGWLLVPAGALVFGLGWFGRSFIEPPLAPFVPVPLAEPRVEPTAVPTTPVEPRTPPPPRSTTRVAPPPMKRTPDPIVTKPVPAVAPPPPPAAKPERTRAPRLLDRARDLALRTKGTPLEARSARLVFQVQALSLKPGADDTRLRAQLDELEEAMLNPR